MPRTRAQKRSLEQNRASVEETETTPERNDRRTSRRNAIESTVSEDCHNLTENQNEIDSVPTESTVSENSHNLTGNRNEIDPNRMNSDSEFQSQS